MMEILTLMDMISRSSVIEANDLSANEAAENFMRLMTPFMAALSLQEEQVRNIPVSDSIETIMEDENSVLEAITKKEEDAYPLAAWLTLTDFIPPEEQEQTFPPLSGEERELTEPLLTHSVEQEEMQVLPTIDAQSDELSAVTLQQISLEKGNLPEEKITTQAFVLPNPEEARMSSSKNDVLSIDSNDTDLLAALKTVAPSSFKDFIHMPATE